LKPKTKFWILSILTPYDLYGKIESPFQKGKKNIREKRSKMDNPKTLVTLDTQDENKQSK
jgi:hypothetical protein